MNNEARSYAAQVLRDIAAEYKRDLERGGPLNVAVEAATWEIIDDLELRADELASKPDRWEVVHEEGLFHLVRNGVTRGPAWGTFNAASYQAKFLNGELEG